MKNILYVNPRCELYKGCQLNALAKHGVTASFVRLVDWVFCDEPTVVKQFLNAAQLPIYYDKVNEVYGGVLVFEPVQATNISTRPIPAFTATFVFEVFYALMAGFEIAGLIPLDAGIKHYHSMGGAPPRVYTVGDTSCRITAPTMPKVIDPDRYVGIPQPYYCNLSAVPVLTHILAEIHWHGLSTSGKALWSTTLSAEFQAATSQQALEMLLQRLAQLGECTPVDRKKARRADADTPLVLAYPTSTPHVAQRAVVREGESDVEAFEDVNAKHPPGTSVARIMPDAIQKRIFKAQPFLQKFRQLSDAIPLIQKERLWPIIGSCMDAQMQTRAERGWKHRHEEKGKGPPEEGNG